MGKRKESGNPSVLKFIYGLKPDSGLALEMNEAASLAKQKSDLEDEYMYFSDILEDEKEEAREIGLAEGRAEGRAKGREEGRAEGREEGRVEGLELGRQQQKLDSARNLLRSKLLTPSQIAQNLDLTLEEVIQLSEK